MENDGLHMKR